MNSLLYLLQLSDPALPIGGFSHSAGLETYVQSGIVRNKKTAADFISAQLSQNIFYTDSAFLSLAFDAASVGDIEQLVTLDEECSAVKMPREIRQASEKMGRRLLKLFTILYDHEVVGQFKNEVDAGTVCGHYAVVFGMFSFALAIEKKVALNGFYYNAAAGMVTNCVKLVPLGQTDGQEILFSLHSLVEELSEKSIRPDRSLLGLSCTCFDIRCMQHEQLYSRLYMS